MIIKQDKNAPLTVLWEKNLVDQFEKVTELCVSRFTDKEELLEAIEKTLKGLEVVKTSVAAMQQ